MYRTLCIAALAGLACSAPQAIDLGEIATDFPPPELVKAPFDVVSDIPPMSTPAAIVPIPTGSVNEKRGAACSPYPGTGPVPSPDTPDAFHSYPDFATWANSAPTPDGYTLVFSNLSASLEASNYLGLYPLDFYDPLTCAATCDSQPSCHAFNVFLERDPPMNTGCANPTSTTNYRCTLFGVPVTSLLATNTDEYVGNFHIVIAGSNAYNKNAPPPAAEGYWGPYSYGGAINAPAESGSYIGYQYFPFSQSQGYDPQRCADACGAQTIYDSQHPAADGSFMSCVFFNAYVLSKNSVPQGLYCSMYNQTWAPEYATNYGQWRGSDRYTVSESYLYENKTYENARVSSQLQQLTPVTTFGVPASTASSNSPLTTSSPSASPTPPTTSSASSTTSSRTLTSSAASVTPSRVCNSTTVLVNGYPVQNDYYRLQNPGFETGALPPWTVTNVVGNATYSFTAPGNNAGGSISKYAFSASLAPNASSHGNSSLSLRQTMPTCVGVNYTVGFYHKFGTTGNVGDCSITVSYPWKTDVRYGFTGLTVTDLLNPPDQWFTTNAGEWFGSSIQFTALTAADVFELVFSCRGGQTNVIGLDDVDVELYLPLYH